MYYLKLTIIENISIKKENNSQHFCVALHMCTRDIDLRKVCYALNMFHTAPHPKISMQHSWDRLVNLEMLARFLDAICRFPSLYRDLKSPGCPEECRLHHMKILLSLA